MTSKHFAKFRIALLVIILTLVSQGRAVAFQQAVTTDESTRALLLAMKGDNRSIEQLAIGKWQNLSLH
jgi:hypothetical protein